MKERIILCGCQRKFDDFAYEIRHHRATAAAQWFEVCDVRNGHIVRKFEDVVPILLSIHGPGAKALSLVLVHVAVDFCRPARKFHTLSEETTIVIQVVDIEFTSAASDSGDILGRNLVTLLWDNLIRGLEAIGIIEIHQVEREIAARMGFDVVRHDEATGGAIWPKPNERHL